VWQEDESPYQLMAQGLKDRGLAGGKLGIEETMRFVFADGIAKAAPQANISSATPVTAGCRMIKSAHEIALMRLAAQVTLAAYEAVYHALHPGMTQQDASNLIDAAYRQLGFPGDASIMVDEYTASPHGSTTPQVIREGSILMIDDGCTVEGYQSDITRTFVLGKNRGQCRRQNEKSVRHRAARAVGGVGCGASGSRVRVNRCRRAKSNPMPATVPTTSTSPTGSATAWAWMGMSGRISSAATARSCRRT
jgi:Xaa-Pro dipeptidase